MEVVILSGAEADLDEIHARLEESGGGEKFLRATDHKSWNSFGHFQKWHRDPRL